MMNLAEYRRSNTRLADFLPWAALVDEGIILNKDGSFQRTAKFRGALKRPILVQDDPLIDKSRPR